MVFMFDNIHFSYSTSLHEGSDLINIDLDFLHQMSDCLFFKDKIHIILGRDQLNEISVSVCTEKAKGKQFSLLSSLVLNITWIQTLVSMHYCTGDCFTGGKLGSFLKVFYNTYLYLLVFCTSRT